MERDLICKRCLIKVGSETTIKTVEPKKVKLCASCKKVSLAQQKKKLIDRNKSIKIKEKNSKRMKDNNPMFNEKTRKKVSSTLKKEYKSGNLKSCFSDPKKLSEIKAKWKISDSGRKSISDNMKINNPMFDKECVKRKDKTFNAKVKSGEIKYKKGKDHHLWKGNRSFSDTLRVQLYPVWTKKCLERDNFQCTNCNSNQNLTVHHLKPLRNFISDVLIKYNINSFNDISSDQWKLYLIIMIPQGFLLACTELYLEKVFNEDKGQ